MPSIRGPRQAVVKESGDPSHPTHLNASLLEICGLVLLSLSLGVQLMLAGLILFGPVRDSQGSAALTKRAMSLSNPEHDLSIYAGGICLTLLLVFTFSRAWRRVLAGRCWPRLMERISSGDDTRYRQYAAFLQLAMAGISLTIFLLLLATRFPVRDDGYRSAPEPLGGLLLLLPGIAAIVCLLLDLRFGFPASDESQQAQSDERLARRGRIAGGFVDILLPILIVLIVYIRPPVWPHLAGNFLLKDQLESWSYFAMGPALAFKSGGALATEFYSQYGMGWPITFAALDHLIPLSYANIIGFGITFGCIYYIALYFFLRLLFRNSIWAAVGAILAILLQIFSGIDLGSVQWLYPSSTMLRHPFDIAFFMALLIHRRSGRFPWIFVAGGSAGLAAFFDLDTGLYLPVTFALYWLLTHWPLNDRHLLKRNFWSQVLAFVATTAAVLATGLMMGSRGTIFHSAFWPGYLEGLRLQAFSGFGLLPVAGNVTWGILLFALMVVVDLFPVYFAISRKLFGDGTISDIDLLLACLGAYGLGMLLIFVGRSHPYNLFHASVPFAMVATGLLFRARQSLARSMAWTSIPWAVAVVLLMVLCTKPQFLEYPSLIKSAFVSEAATGGAGAAMQDQPRDLVLPEQSQNDVTAIRNLVATLRQLSAADKQIAVLDSWDTPLYYLSGLKPWSRYTSLFHCMITQEMLQHTADELVQRKPEYVVIQSPPSVPPNWEFEDVWKKFQTVLPDHYVPYQRIGAYEIWQLRPTTPN